MQRTGGMKITKTQASHRIMSTVAGLTKMTIGYRAAACSRLMALPLTSKIQCLPCSIHQNYMYT